MAMRGGQKYQQSRMIQKRRQTVHGCQSHHRCSHRLRDAMVLVRRKRSICCGARTKISNTLSHHEGTLQFAKDNCSAPRRNELASNDVDDEAIKKG